MTKETFDHTRFRGTKVLVVDDEPQILRLLKKFLEARGYAFVGASNADEAMTQFKEHRPPLVFLDINLPDRNGLEVLQEMQRIDGNVSIVIISGWAGDVIGSKALELGAFEFIDKPFDFEHLERVLWINLATKSLDKKDTDTE